MHSAAKERGRVRSLVRARTPTRWASRQYSLRLLKTKKCESTNNRRTRAAPLVTRAALQPKRGLTRVPSAGADILDSDANEIRTPLLPNVVEPRPPQDLINSSKDFSLIETSVQMVHPEPWQGNHRCKQSNSTVCKRADGTRIRLRGVVRVTT